MEMQFGDDGAKYLAEYLRKKGHIIESLDISGNSITAAGFV